VKWEIFALFDVKWSAASNVPARFDVTHSGRSQANVKYAMPTTRGGSVTEIPSQPSRVIEMRKAKPSDFQFLTPGPMISKVQSPPTDREDPIP
jgi:hypothetical protein